MPATTLQMRLTPGKLTAIALDASGELVAQASSPVETRAPEPGWLEQRPDEWWDALTTAIAALRTNISMTGVTSVSVASDVAAAVFLDGEREVIRPAVLEGDVRGPHPIAWLRLHQPIAYKRVQHLLQPADYLRLMLTGEIATTPTDAERTGLFDATVKAWDEHRCEDLEINVELLPSIRSDAVPVLGDVAATLALPEGVVVV